MKREPTDYWGAIFQSISAHHRLGVLPGPNQPAPALHMGPAHGIHGFFRCLLFIRSALSDRHVTVASHQPLKNFIPKKKTSEEFPAEKPRVKLLFFTNLRWTWFSTRGYHISSSTVNQNQPPQLCGKHKTDRSIY